MSEEKLDAGPEGLGTIEQWAKGIYWIGLSEAEHRRRIQIALEEVMSLRASLATEREKNAALAVTIEIKNLAICRADHVLRDDGYSDESEERLNLYRAAIIPDNAKEVLRERDAERKSEGAYEIVEYLRKEVAAIGEQSPGFNYMYRLFMGAGGVARKIKEAAQVEAARRRKS